MKTVVRIQKVTSKGQVTLPSAWRNLRDTAHVFVETKNDSVVITAAYPEKMRSPAVQEYTVFDAIRDNKGKGIRADNLLKLLKKINAHG